MAGKQPNMKVNVTADNSDLTRKMRESKSAIQDFEKVSDKALESFAESLGVNVGSIQKVTSAVRGLGAKLQETGNAGTAALGKALLSINGLSAGIAGLGIGAVVAGFKMLNDEAENFKSTVAGANIEMATAAYIDTYRQVIHDFNNEVGEGAANAQSNWKKFFSSIGPAFKAMLATGVLGSTDMSGVGDFNNQALVNYNALLSEANDKARTAEQISNEIYATQREISDKAVEWARMEREIAEYKRIAYDKTVSTAEQQSALASAVELITQRFGEQAELQGRLADLQAEYNNLASSSVADIDKANDLRIKAEQITASMNNALRELSERQATVALNAKKEADERAKSLAAAKELAAAKASLQDWRNEASATLTPGKGGLYDSLPQGLEAPDAGIAIPITPVLDTSAVTDITNELESVLSSAFDSIGASIGGLIGDLATGGDAWGNFSNAALSAIGDMAISVGKMAISTGVATLGIKAALESLNGYVAIAAGVALVALGTAVKSGLGNIASGGYSYSSNVAYAGGSGSSGVVTPDFETMPMNIRVSGTLRGSGNELLGVIESENVRLSSTT